MIPHLLVTGWYGTETTGDKAILAGIIQATMSVNPSVRFTITSLNKRHTENTISEIGFEDCCEVVSFRETLKNPSASRYTAVIMGGGPLMDIPEVFSVIRLLDHMRRRRVFTALIGIGIGPFRRRIVKWGAGHLLRIVNTVSVRDEDAYTRAIEMGCPAERIMWGADPSIIYINAIEDTLPSPMPVRNAASDDQTARPAMKQRSEQREKKVLPIIGLALRDWPRIYATELNDQEYQHRRAELLSVWTELVENLVEETSCLIRLIPMNTFHAGTDDRAFLGELYQRLASTDSVELSASSYSPAEILALIKSCDLLVGMRYHSVIFGTTLKVPTLAVDYTQGSGKVSGYMNLIGMDQWVIGIDNVDFPVVFHRTIDLLRCSEEIENLLQGQRQKMLSLAESVVMEPLKHVVQIGSA